MSAPIVPLGQLEDQQLEFKSAKEIENISRSKSDLGRSVAAMLNAGGGEIWIGIADDNGRASGTESIANPERARDAVENHLSSTIDPRLAPGEAVVEVVTQATSALLRVRVGPGSNKPYAFTRQGLRYYIRVGSRVRDMTRDEVMKLGRLSSAIESESASALDEAQAALEQRRAKLSSLPDPVFWVALRVARPSKGERVLFDLDDVRKRNLLTDASRTGSRRGGVLATDRIDAKRVSDDLLRLAHTGWGTLEVTKDGSVDQIIPHDRLWDRSFRDRTPEEGHLIQPILLIENLTFPFRVLGAALAGSAFRVRRSVRTKVDINDLREIEVAVSAGMFHAHGLRMRPGSPDTMAYLHMDAERELPTTDGHWHREDVLAASELVENPDLGAFRLTSRLYNDLGFEWPAPQGADAIPRQFDRVTGRLVLSE